MIGIGFAISIAFTTYFQWRDAHKNFIIDERAWIELRFERPSVNSNELGTRPFTLHALNIGKTPAIGVEILVNGEVIPNTQAPSLSYDNGGTRDTVGLYTQMSRRRFRSSSPCLLISSARLFSRDKHISPSTLPPHGRTFSGNLIGLIFASFNLSAMA